MSALECADQIDQAARALGTADVLLGDPDFDRVEVERLLLDALKLVLNATGALARGAVVSRAPFVGPGEASTLVDFATAREPGAPLAFLRGWLVKASTEAVSPASARRVLADVETALRESLPPVAPAASAGPVVVQGGRR